MKPDIFSLETVKLTKEGLIQLQNYLKYMKKIYGDNPLYMAMQFHHLNEVDKERNFTAPKDVIQCIFGNNFPLYIESIVKDEYLSNDSEEVKLAV